MRCTQRKTQMTILRDPNSGQGAGIDGNNRLHVRSTSETAVLAAAQDGTAYNINTGLITGLTGTGDHSILYFKNDESPSNGESSIIIDAIALWVGTRGATVTDDPIWTILKNPDGGDIISDATAASIVSNSNFGVNTSLSTTTLAYKGKNGGTITSTDGEHALIAGTGRIYAPLSIVLSRGGSVGIKVDINTSGAASAYAALILRRLDGKSQL